MLSYVSWFDRVHCRNAFLFRIFINIFDRNVGEKKIWKFKTFYRIEFHVDDLNLNGIGLVLLAKVEAK